MLRERVLGIYPNERKEVVGTQAEVLASTQPDGYFGVCEDTGAMVKRVNGAWVEEGELVYSTVPQENVGPTVNVLGIGYYWSDIGGGGAGGYTKMGQHPWVGATAPVVDMGPVRVGASEAVAVVMAWEYGAYSKPAAPGGKILLIGDSLGVIHTRHGFKRSSGSMSGVSSYSVRAPATGNATLKFYAEDGSLSWTAPGDIEGPRVVITYPKSAKLYSADGVSYLYCSIIPSRLPTVDTSVTQVIAYEDTTFYGSVPVAGAYQGHIETMLRAFSESGITVANRSCGGIVYSQLCDLVSGVIADPTAASDLEGVSRVVIVCGTNNMLGSGSIDPPEDWMSYLTTAIRKARSIAPVVVLAPPMPTLSDATKQENAWKYLWNPLRATCEAAGAICIHPFEASFGASVSAPDPGMIPDSAHQSGALNWIAIPEIVKELVSSRVHSYLPTEADDYNASTNPTGNLLGFVAPTGTAGTAGTGGVATALYTSWVVERTAGAATITATQEKLDNVSAPWQKLTMTGATAITDITRCYRDVTFTPPAEGVALGGLVEMRIPAQSGLRRIGVRIEALGADGRMLVWDNEKITSAYPSIPNQEYKLLIPLDEMIVPTGMTGVRIGFYMQTEIGATASVYFRRMSLSPKE